MKLAILSDARLPTNPAFAGHGLGQIVHAVATGLAARGHDVTLLAAPNSKFEAGKLVTATDEADFLRHDLTQFDAVIDNTHEHVTGQIRNLPALQVSHDREARPTANAVFPSEAHREWHDFTEVNGKVVHNGVKLPDLSTFGERRGGYAAFLSMFYAPKQPIAALEACRLAGVKLLMAGPTPPAPPPGATYIGPLSGLDKLEFLYHADVLIHPASMEAAPVTILESLSVGTPVVVSALGGASENMLPGKTGLCAYDIEGFAEALQQVGKIDRAACRQYVVNCRSERAMIDGYEGLLEAVKNGERW